MSSSTLVYADADIAVQPAGTPTQATANVDICVVVPEILIFGVGSLGDTISKVTWTFSDAIGTGIGNNQTYAGPAVPPFTTPAPFSALVASLTNGGIGSFVAGAVATLPVYLFSNNGTDVTITVDSLSGGATGGGTVDALDESGGTNTIAISEFTSGDGGTISHPTLTQGSVADTTATAGVVNAADTWTYTYTPVATPAAGTYEARITYIAAQP